jgi:hypothetical protein
MNDALADSERAQKYWLPGAKGDVANRIATNFPKNKPKLVAHYGRWKYNLSLNQNIFRRKK